MTTRRCLTTYSIVCITLILAFVLAAPAPAGGPPGGEAREYQMKYEVQRNGSPIGHYHFHVREGADSYSFEAKLDIDVTVFGFTVYELRHKRSEKWHSGQLVSLQGTSVYDDDERYKIHLKSNNRHSYRLTVNDTTQKLTGRVVSFSPRQPRDWDKARLISLKGDADAITKKDLGETTITVQGTDYNARHYRLAGDVVRDLWYDASGRLLKLSYKKDGDRIAFVRTALETGQ
jgi:hypothetical protein